jgi:hypothetical protein
MDTPAPDVCGLCDQCDKGCTACESCESWACACNVATTSVNFDTQWMFVLAKIMAARRSPNPTATPSPEARKCSSCEKLYCFDCHPNAYCSEPGCDRFYCDDCQTNAYWCADCEKHYCRMCRHSSSCPGCYLSKCGCGEGAGSALCKWCLKKEGNGD